MAYTNPKNPYTSDEMYRDLLSKPLLNPEQYMRMTGMSDLSLGVKEMSMNMAFGSLRITRDIKSLYKDFAKIHCEDSVYMFDSAHGDFEAKQTIMGGLYGATPVELSSFTVRKTTVNLEPVKMYSDYRNRQTLPMWDVSLEDKLITKILNTPPVNRLDPADELKIINLQSITMDIFQTNPDFNVCRFLNFKLNNFMNIGVIFPDINKIKIIENHTSNLIGLHIPDKCLYTTTYRRYELENEFNSNQRLY